MLRRLRLRLPTLPTERLQQVLTQVGGVALTLWQHGPQAAWQAISAQAQGLRAQALDFVQQQVLAVAAKAVPLFLASLAVPGGAFLQLARGLYNGVLLFVEKGKQLAQVGQALFASAAAIAAGQLAPAAQAVENTLVKLLPVALSFLARQLGLDGISGAIQTGLKKVRGPVEKAVNRVLDTVADKANAIWGAVKAGAGQVVGKNKALATAAASKVAGWLGLRKPFTTPEKEQHTLFLDGTEADSRLMVASTPMPLLTYLRQAQRRTQALPDGDAKTTQLQFIEEAARLAGRHRVVVAGQAPAQLTARVVEELEQISQLLARIGGLPSGQAPLPRYQGPAAKESSRDRVSTRSSEQASNIPETVKPAGWAELQGSGLTKNADWVRMHLVSAKTGGLPVVQNLVVATRMANKRAEDFETQVKRLVEVPGDKPGVVWVRTYVTEFYPAGAGPVPYPAQAFPVQVHFTAGLYYYAPEAGQPAWRKDPQIRLATSVQGEVPKLSGTPRYLGGLGVPAIIAAVKLASGQEIPVRFAQDIRELYTKYHLAPTRPEGLMAQLKKIGALTRTIKEQTTYNQRVENLFGAIDAAIGKTLKLVQ